MAAVLCGIAGLCARQWIAYKRISASALVIELKLNPRVAGLRRATGIPFVPLFDSIQIVQVNLTATNHSVLSELGGRIPIGRTILVVDVLDAPTCRQLGTIPSLRVLAVQRLDTDIRCLSGLRRLEALDLTNLAITDRDIFTLSALNAIRTLDLSGTQITKVGIERIATMPRLRNLIVIGTKVGNDSVRVLARHSQIELLRLDETMIDDNVADSFKGFDSLKYVGVSGNNLSDQAIADIRRVLGPGVNVINWSNSE